MPELAGSVFEAGDLGLAVFPTNDAAVSELAAAAGIERRCCERDLARAGVGDLRLDDQRLGLFVTEKMHANPLPPSAARLLAKIAYAAAARANCKGVIP